MSEALPINLKVDELVTELANKAMHYPGETDTPIVTDPAWVHGCFQEMGLRLMELQESRLSTVVEALESAQEHQLIAVDRYHEIQELKRRNQLLTETAKLAGDSLALFLSAISESKADQIAEENAIKFAYDQGRKALEKLNEAILRDFPQEPKP